MIRSEINSFFEITEYIRQFNTFKVLEPRVEKLEQNAENKYYDGEFQEIVKQTFQKNPTIISSLPDISVSNILLRCLDEKCPRQLC